MRWGSSISDSESSGDESSTEAGDNLSDELNVAYEEEEEKEESIARIDNTFLFLSSIVVKYYPKLNLKCASAVYYHLTILF